MTDHADLVTLSATLDGEPESAHVQGCALCRGRLAELRMARDAVAKPVTPVPDEMRDRAIAHALAAATEAAEPDAHVADLRPHRPAWPERRGRPAWPERRGRKWWLGGSAAAAVVAVVVGAAALVGSVGRSNDDKQTAFGSDSAAERAAGGAAEVLDAGDLGDVATIDALRSKVPAAAAPAAAPSAGGALTATADTAAPAPRQVGTRVCEIEARTARPLLGFVVYAANLRFQGTPAVALGFAVTPGGPPETLLVLAPQQECRILAEASLS